MGTVAERLHAGPYTRRYIDTIHMYLYRRATGWTRSSRGKRRCSGFFRSIVECTRAVATMSRRFAQRRNQSSSKGLSERKMTLFTELMMMMMMTGKTS